MREGFPYLDIQINQQTILFFPLRLPGGGSLPLGALSYFAYRGAMADLQAFRDR